jgi:hypothetical protein
MNADHRKKALTLYFWSTIVSLFVLAALTVAQTYVRWVINQNFSFLPGFGFEAVAIMCLGLLLGLAYLLKE